MRTKLQEILGEVTHITQFKKVALTHHNPNMELIIISEGYKHHLLYSTLYILGFLGYE